MTDDTLAKMDAQAADARLEEIQDILTALTDNPEVNGHAAEDYIGEAIDSLDAARVDMRDAIKNHDADDTRTR